MPTFSLMELKGEDEVVKKMKLIQPETFDSFRLAILSWYENECRNSIDYGIPNLYWIEEESGPLIEGIFATFIESMAFERAKRNGEDIAERGSDAFHALAEYFFESYFQTSLAGKVIHDISLLLNSMNITFCLDYGELSTEGINEIEVYSPVLSEVW